jgi:hypothetical protein
MLPWYLFQKSDWLYAPAKSTCSESRIFFEGEEVSHQRTFGEYFGKGLLR